MGISVLDQFRGLTGAKFDFASADHGQFAAVLTSVDNVVVNEAQTSFSLIFASPTETVPHQGTFTATNETLGTTEIFLVPIRKTAGEVTFEAVFNLLNK